MKQYDRAIKQIAAMYNIHQRPDGTWLYGATPVKFYNYFDDRDGYYSMYGWELGKKVEHILNGSILLVVMEYKNYAKYLWRLGEILTCQSDGLGWPNAKKLQLPRRE